MACIGTRMQRESFFDRRLRSFLPSRITHDDAACTTAFAQDRIQKTDHEPPTDEYHVRTRQSAMRPARKANPAEVNCRPFNSHDVPMLALHVASDDGELAKYLTGLEQFRDPATMRRTIADVQAKSKTEYQTLTYRDLPAGMAALTPRRKKRVDLTYVWTGRDYRGRSVTALAMQKLCHHYLHERSFRAITLKIDDANVASKALHEKLGARKIYSRKFSNGGVYHYYEIKKPFVRQTYSVGTSILGTTFMQKRRSAKNA